MLSLDAIDEASRTNLLASLWASVSEARSAKRPLPPLGKVLPDALLGCVQIGVCGMIQSVKQSELCLQISVSGYVAILVTKVGQHNDPALATWSGPLKGCTGLPDISLGRFSCKSAKGQRSTNSN